MTRFAPAALAACCLLPAAAPAADWPEFRGPTGQGVAAGDAWPLTWSDTKNVAWKKAVDGEGWSSPVVAGGRVYLTTAAPVKGSDKDLSLRALCLDAKSGKVLWDQEVFRQDGGKAPGIHSKNSHASPTPVVSGDRLYVHFGHQGTACLDAKSGKVLWENRSLSYSPVHGNGGSPALVDGLLVFSRDGATVRDLVALDAKTGKVRWQAKRAAAPWKRFSFSTPLVLEVKGKKQIVSPGSGMVGAYDPATGKEIWRVRYSGYSVVPRPAYAHGLVFLSTGYDAPELLAIDPTGEGDVTATHVKWRLRKGAPNTPSPLPLGDELYVVSDGGVVSCLDAKTGKAHWQRRVPGAHSASPLAAGGRLYLQAEDGTGVVLQAGKEYKLLGRNPLGERALASYAAADGALFIRTEKHLFKVQAE